MTIARSLYWILYLNCIALIGLYFKRSIAYYIMKLQIAAQGLLFLTGLLTVIYFRGKLNNKLIHSENYFTYTKLHSNVPSNQSSDNIEFVKW